MHIHRPKPLTGVRSFLGEVAVILVGIVLAILLEQQVEALRWRHQAGDARRALGQEVSYNLKVLEDMQGQDPCIQRRLDQLQLWAASSGPRPTEAEHRPVLLTLQTSTWDIVNSGQVVAHFALAEEIRFAQAYGRFDNERATVAEERDAWQTIASIAAASALDDEDRRALRRAVGLARTIGQRRRGNAGLILQDSRPLAARNSAPLPRSTNGGSPADFCRVTATA